jgi:uncharacterized protein (TIGR02597 family)
MTITFAAAVSGVPKISTFTPALRMPVSGSFVGKVRGTLTGVTSSTLTDSSAGWTTSALSTAATPYCLRITSGAASGSWWQISSTTASTSTTVTIINRGINPVAAGIVAGDSYEVVPIDTLSTFFAGIASQIGGTSAANADLVRIHDGVNWKEYYFNTTVSQWREGTSSFNRNNIVLRPDYGVVFVRRGATPVSMVMVGNVSTQPERIVVSASGVTPVGNVFPVQMTLLQHALHASSGFIRNTGSVAAADKVQYFDGVNWKTYNYNNSVSQWREGTATFNRNTIPISVGSTLVVERPSGGGTAFFVTLNPPYSL